jgi:hypothetical protein
MSTTRNLLSSALFSLPFLGNQPVNISNGEPAVNAANLVKQVILGPPFTWPWNRTTFEIAISQALGQDYVITPTSDYGFLEKVWLTDSNGNVTEIKIVLALAEESRKQRPASAAAQTTNIDGTFLLRLNTIPDQSYTLRGFFQNAPVYMTSLAATWTPIPDHLGYIYDWGYLAILGLITKDVRVPFFGQRFVSHLLGAQDGLSSTQRNIFLGNWIDLISEPQRMAAQVQQASAARGAS